MGNVLNQIFNFGKGYATKIGLVGGFLAAVGALLTQFAADPCHDLACWLDMATKLGAALAVFGGARKVVTIGEKAGA